MVISGTFKGREQEMEVQIFLDSLTAWIKVNAQRLLTTL